MSNISDNNKIEFYKFLNGDISIADFEKFIYSQTDLEHQLDEKIYLELILFNFNDKYIKVLLSDFIKEYIIDEGQYETWKLKIILVDLIADQHNLHIYLDKLYHLYCGIYQDNGVRKYEFKFLSHLGLNYLYWMDKEYFKTHSSSSNWEVKYEKYFAEFEFYHQQLKPFAIDILAALNNKEIQILNDGTYSITENIKQKLEPDNIYKLKHPNQNIH
ncbi:hypothetical protein VB264_21355 [Arcicella aquatica]|uniref:Uncharacterized protein n=1 Tax=Arcicella aquatica TaxID=217141 RepID=A0ABU5QVJ9_9BACT|nr:hypothetical protein [Arcicella aquatica]MEA5260361.1 hypothetical protein [Arcicella aquatica]